jgi:hypothetical protein
MRPHSPNDLDLGEGTGRSIRLAPKVTAKRAGLRLRHDELYERRGIEVDHLSLGVASPLQPPARRLDAGRRPNRRAEIEQIARGRLQPAGGN